MKILNGIKIQEHNYLETQCHIQVEQNLKLYCCKILKTPKECLVFL